ncbi:MAG: sulfatase [Myxococcota bacterium]|nr:sulfatase-like hydrolase/transferase [bacterium]MDP6075797.1 sulfatase [Myxococcota bacterium]MDP6242572.1 sulfatase [Myxococcota bacterium]MDP7075542.1 sulfatase [Myxococcota bacterium]MDP7299705.1 sulfatase [Myxococcota bacterium]
MSARHRKRTVLLLLAGLAACTPEPEPLPNPQRIVLVSLDTVRADALANPSPEELPNLTALAAEGAHFSQAWAAASYTLPSHAAMLTGHDAAEHPLDAEHPSLDTDTPTLAERLRTAGFATAGFHEGGYLREGYGFGRGFELYQLLPRRGMIQKTFDLVLDWIETHADERFFLFVHTYAAHDPYGGWDTLRREHPELGLPAAPAVRALADEYPDDDPAQLPPVHRQLFQLYNPLADRDRHRVDVVARRPVEAVAESPYFALGVAAMRAGYAARVRSIDTAIGRLRERLEALGLWEDTLLVVTSDHGEAFYEHGQPWHGYSPYEEVLRVPWIISWPRLFADRGPVEIEAPVWHLDLVPTLLALVGLEPDVSLRGHNLSGALAQTEELESERDLFPLVLEVDFLDREPPRRVAIHPPLKFVPYHPRFHADGDQLFDLETDPGETRNLLAAQPEEARKLRIAADAYEAGLRRPSAPATTGPDAETFEDLRRLGYVE